MSELDALLTARYFADAEEYVIDGGYGQGLHVRRCVALDAKAHVLGEIIILDIGGSHEQTHD